MILGADESAYLRVNPPHPGGAFQRGWLDANDEYPGMTLDKAAEKLGIDRAALSRIVEGREPISMNLALKMETLGWSVADDWLRRQLDYDLAQARKQRNQPLAKAPAVLRGKKMLAEAAAEDSPEEHKNTDNADRGDTQESLNMLKSEEGQLNAVFACHGSATQNGQLFEESLNGLLDRVNKICDQNFSLTNLQTDRIKKKTIGQLLNSLDKYVTFDNAKVRSLLTDACEQRNFLIHRYFLDRRDKFKTHFGRMEMLQELITIQANIKKAASITGGICVAIDKTLNSSQEKHNSEPALFSIKIKDSKAQ